MGRRDCCELGVASCFRCKVACRFLTGRQTERVTVQENLSRGVRSYLAHNHGYKKNKTVQYRNGGFISLGDFAAAGDEGRRSGETAGFSRQPRHTAAGLPADFTRAAAAGHLDNFLLPERLPPLAHRLALPGPGTAAPQGLLLRRVERRLAATQMSDDEIRVAVGDGLEGPLAGARPAPVRHVGEEFVVEDLGLHGHVAPDLLNELLQTRRGHVGGNLEAHGLGVVVFPAQRRVRAAVRQPRGDHHEEVLLPEARLRRQGLEEPVDLLGGEEFLEFARVPREESHRFQFLRVHFGEAFGDHLDDLFDDRVDEEGHHLVDVFGDVLVRSAPGVRHEDGAAAFPALVGRPQNHSQLQSHVRVEGSTTFYTGLSPPAAGGPTATQGSCIWSASNFIYIIL